MSTLSSDEVLRVLRAHQGDLMSARQVVKASGRDPEVWDDLSLAIHWLCNLVDRGRGGVERFHRGGDALYRIPLDDER